MEGGKPHLNPRRQAPTETLQGSLREAKYGVSKGCKWLPTSRSVLHNGMLRKVWTLVRGAKGGPVHAVKRMVEAADGSRRARYERVRQ